LAGDPVQHPSKVQNDPSGLPRSARQRWYTRCESQAGVRRLNATPFFQSCKHDPVPLPRQDSRRRSGGELGAGDELTSDRGGLDLDRFFRDKDLEELTRKTYDNMGLEVRDVLAKSDLYEREGKNQHGFCLAVGREYPYDVRVLVNVRPPTEKSRCGNTKACDAPS
jgi:hypothetical protein